MKILVMGATGRVGRAVVEVARERDHVVTAFARKPESMGARGPNVSPFPGDALQPARVAEAVPGHDAVVSALGKKGDQPTLTEGLRNLLAAMRQHEVRRIVVIGARGVLDDPRGGLVRDLPGFPPMLERISAEHLAAFRELQASGLDWTMLCPGRMTEGSVGELRLSANRALPSDGPVGYSDAAEAVLDLLEQGRFVNQRVAIAPADEAGRPAGVADPRADGS